MKSIKESIKKLKEKAHHLKQEAYALLIAYRSPDVPWYAKAVIILVIAHTFSPIDLIPDFIPVLGYLDDLIITPLGIALAIKMIPPEIMKQARKEVNHTIHEKKPINYVYAGLIILFWAYIFLRISQYIWHFLAK